MQSVSMRRALIVSASKVFSFASADRNGSIVMKKNFIIVIKANIFRINKIGAMAQNKVTEAFFALKIRQLS